MSFYAGKDSNGNPLLHVTREEKTEQQLKSNIYNDTLVHSSVPWVTIEQEWSIPFTSTSISSSINEKVHYADFPDTLIQSLATEDNIYIVVAETNIGIVEVTPEPNNFVNSFRSIASNINPYSGYSMLSYGVPGFGAGPLMIPMANGFMFSNSKWKQAKNYMGQPGARFGPNITSGGQAVNSYGSVGFSSIGWEGYNLTSTVIADSKPYLRASAKCVIFYGAEPRTYRLDGNDRVRNYQLGRSTQETEVNLESPIPLNLKVYKLNIKTSYSGYEFQPQVANAGEITIDSTKINIGNVSILEKKKFLLSNHDLKNRYPLVPGNVGNEIIPARNVYDRPIINGLPSGKLPYRYNETSGVGSIKLATPFQAIYNLAHRKGASLVPSRCFNAFMWGTHYNDYFGSTSTWCSESSARRMEAAASGQYNRQRYFEISETPSTIDQVELTPTSIMLNGNYKLFDESYAPSSNLGMKTSGSLSGGGTEIEVPLVDGSIVVKTLDSIVIEDGPEENIQNTVDIIYSMSSSSGTASTASTCWVQPTKVTLNVQAGTPELQAHLASLDVGEMVNVGTVSCIAAHLPTLGPENRAYASATVSYYLRRSARKLNLIAVAHANNYRTAGSVKVTMPRMTFNIARLYGAGTTY